MKKFFPKFIGFIIRVIAATQRVTVDDRAGVLKVRDREPVIIAFWHNRTFLMAPFYERFCGRFGRTSYTFISRSRDGQFMTEVANCFGVQAVRGSSSRHGMAAALAAMRKASEPLHDLTITPDGPRGPVYKVQSGVLRIAQATGRPIVAIDNRIAWKFELRNWDKFQIPVPFSRCHLTTAEMIRVPESATEEELAAIAGRLEQALGSRL
jgi:lysophospholipid acyltransferase (LPLAT)-like uncharacterized protein